MFKILQKRNKIFLKIALVALFMVMSLCVLNVAKTNAYFSDTKSSLGDTYTTGILGINLSGGNFSGIVAPGGTTNVTTVLSKSNSTNLDYQYIASVIFVGGDTTACDYITLTASSTSQNYSGPVKNFISATSSPSGSVPWDFTFSVASGVSPADLGKVCNFKISYTAWQTNLPDSSQGFSNIAEMTESIQVGTAPTVLGSGDVVINEIMWMGSSGHSSDEWIELRNMTGDAIDIGNWTLEKSKTSGGTLVIPAGKTIPAHGYFLIANYNKDSASSALNVSPDLATSSLSLANSNNGNLILKTNTGTVIDGALGTPGWPAGINGTTLKQSMERDDVPGDGTLSGSWHTCIDSGCNSGTYWNTAGGNNYGTPGGPNLSTNDPTSFDYNPDEVPAGVSEQISESASTTDTPSDSAEPVVVVPVAEEVVETPATSTPPVPDVVPPESSVLPEENQQPAVEQDPIAEPEPVTEVVPDTNVPAQEVSATVAPPPETPVPPVSDAPTN